MAQTYSVSELNGLIKDLVEGSGLVANVQVQGEISNFKKYPSGHCYFTLKDADSLLKCVMFKYRAVNIRRLPNNGDTVLVIGRIKVYERDGVYQLYADVIVPQGQGNLMEAYEKLKAKLEKAGLFDEKRKQALPVNPKRVGIITSPAGAAVRDVITVSRRRNRGIRLLLYPVLVQGSGAAEEIAGAIEFMNRHKLAEVLIVGRGGGSIEDLWAFNEERVVRAIAASKIPIISSVGHETDFTLADFAADVRAATPSQAAELAVADTDSYLRKVIDLRKRAEGSLMHQLRYAEAAYSRLAGRPVLQRPQALLDRPSERLDRALMSLSHRMEQQLSQGEHRLQLLAARLDGVSPLKVLARGYSVTVDAKGKRLTGIDQVAWGSELVTKLEDGEIVSIVQQTERYDKHGG